MEHRLEPLPGAIVVPGAEVAIEPVPGREVVGEQPPGTASAGQIADRIEDLAHVILAGTAPRLGGRDVALQLLPLGIGQIGRIGRSFHTAGLPGPAAFITRSKVPPTLGTRSLRSG